MSQTWASSAGRLPWSRGKSSGPRPLRRWIRWNPRCLVLDDSRAPMYRWFSGGRLNTCYNAIDRPRRAWACRSQVPRRSTDSPSQARQSPLVMSSERDEVTETAGALLEQGVEYGRPRDRLRGDGSGSGHGDAVVGRRTSAIRTVIFGGFAADRLAEVRMEHAKPRIVITAWCGIEVGRIVDYKSRSSTPRSTWAVSEPERCSTSSCNATCSRPISTRIGTSTGREAMAASRRRLIAFMSRSSRFVCSSSTRPEQQVSRRGSCGTTAVTPSRSSQR